MGSHGKKTVSFTRSYNAEVPTQRGKPDCADDASHVSVSKNNQGFERHLRRCASANV